MTANAVLGESDGEDRLIRADAALAALQLRCGGTVPGAIAIPALRELVIKARHFALKLARPIVAQDGADTIRLWAEVTPTDGGGGGGGAGCAIALLNWQASALPVEDATAIDHRRIAIDRALAELTARLDARQCLLAVDGEAPDLAELAAAMRRGVGRPWTDFVRIAGDSHRQPLHWRLLDGAMLSATGSARQWRATLVPQPAAAATPSGFELLLTADVPLAAAPPVAAEPPGHSALVVGREVAPVLRQPLARIIANAETIRARLAGPLDEEYSNYAGDIATAAQHLLALVDELADIEVIEASNFTTAPDPIDLADVARRAAGILGGKARAKGITIVAPPPEATLPATGEFRRTLQVLLNLIGNAIRYSPENSRISLILEAAGERARITVADEGPGLTAPDRVRVFAKFERLGRSGDDGSGLGLYISRRLAHAMGGELSVTGAPGEGARFTLELPAGELPAGGSTETASPAA